MGKDVYVDGTIIIESMDFKYQGTGCLCAIPEGAEVIEPNDIKDGHRWLIIPAYPNGLPSRGQKHPTPRGALALRVFLYRDQREIIRKPLTFYDRQMNIKRITIISPSHETKEVNTTLEKRMG